MQRVPNKNLEERLTAYGKSLLDPPTSREELLKLLDKIEKHLSKVEQSPTKSMQAALAPLMNALIADELLKHSDVDVRVGIASCISEITRITAPDAPYDDAKMKVVFQLIVSSFENLSDRSSRSYNQRANILETVAKVRSCVIMLDLECDKMILEMFNHFFKAIRPQHDELIFASMETIMNLVLDESEEISADLINLILSNSRRDNEANPTAKKLAERVIQSSSDKLKPYLTEALKSLKSSLEDYSEVVASIISENPPSVEHNNESTMKDLTEDGTAESVHPHKDLATDRAPKSVVCNGSREAGTEVAQAATSNAVSNHTHDAKSTHKSEDDLDTEGPGESDGKLEFVKAEKTPENQELQSDSVAVPTGVKSSEEGKPIAVVKDSVTTSASQESANEAADVTSPTQGSIADESRSARKQMSDDPGSQKTSEGGSLSESKKQKSSQRKEVGEVSNKREGFIHEGSHKSDDGSASNSGAISVDQKIATSSGKDEKTHGITSSAPVSEPVVPKRGRGRPRLEKPKSSTIEDHGKEKSSPRSLPKLKKDEVSHERTPRTSSKGKKIAEADRGSEPTEYGEDLIGSKIKVWWPKDHMFYEGVVASFDSVKKKHKVLYTDGDMEILNLHKQRWEFVKDELFSDEDQDVEHSNPNTSDTRSKRKKTTNSDASNKRRNEDKVSPTPDGKPLSDSKSTKSKSGSAKKPSDAIKSEDGSQKQGGKLDNSSGNASNKSNDDSPKTSSHQKQDDEENIKSELPVVRKRGRPVGSGNKSKNSSTPKAKGPDKPKGKADSERSVEKVQEKDVDTSTPEAKSLKKRRK